MSPTPATPSTDHRNRPDRPRSRPREVIMNTIRLELISVWCSSRSANGAKRSACADVVAVQELRDSLDLVIKDQSRRVATVLNRMGAHVAISAHHFHENGF
jgi:hypothetical protein